MLLQWCSQYSVLAERRLKELKPNGSCVGLSFVLTRSFEREGRDNFILKCSFSRLRASLQIRVSIHQQVTLLGRKPFSIISIYLPFFQPTA